MLRRARARAWLRPLCLLSVVARDMEVASTSAAGGSGDHRKTGFSAGTVLGIKRHAVQIADHAGAMAQANAFQRNHHATTAVLEVESKEALETIKYYQQGDIALSSPEAFKKRAKIKRNPLVVAELSRWWDVAIEAARQQHHQPDCISLCFEDYQDIYKLISAKLLDDDYDEGEAEAEALEEWSKDTVDSRFSMCSA